MARALGKVTSAARRARAIWSRINQSVAASYALVLLVALAVNVAFARSDSDPLTHADSHAYLDLASSLRASHSFRSPDPFCVSVAYDPRPERPLLANTVRTPGYPFFLAFVFGLGGGLDTVVWIQRAIVVALAVAILAFCRAKTDASWRLLAPLLFALDPRPAELAGLVMTETLFAATIFMAAVAIQTSDREGAPGWAVAAGILVGIAPLIRPIAIFYALPLAALILLSRGRSFGRTLLFLLFALGVPGLWVARNNSQSGVATISSIGGENVLFFRAAGALVHQPGDGWLALQRQSDFFLRMEHARRPLLDRALNEMTRLRMTPAATNHAQRAVVYSAVGSRIIREHPAAWLRLMFSGVVAMLLDYAWEIPSTHGWMDYRAAAILLVPLAAAGLVAAVAGGWRLVRRDPFTGWLMILTIGYFVALSAGPEAAPRFGVAIAPHLAICTAIGVHRLLSDRQAPLSSDQKGTRLG